MLTCESKDKVGELSGECSHGVVIEGEHKEAVHTRICFNEEKLI